MTPVLAPKWLPAEQPASRNPPSGESEQRKRLDAEDQQHIIQLRDTQALTIRAAQTRDLQ
jgi:hypothetical protein